MVNVSHNNYNRASRLEILCLVLIVNDKSFLDGNNNFLFDLCAQFISNDSRRVKIDYLVDACHNAKSHQLFDNNARSDFKS